MVNIKKGKYTKVSATGIFLGVEDDVLKIEDSKNGIQDLDIVAILKDLVGKKVSIRISHEEDDYDDEEEND